MIKQLKGKGAHWVKHVKSLNNPLVDKACSYQELPKKSYFLKTESMQALLKWEPSFRLLRPLIDYCKKTAEKKNLKFDYLPLTVGEYEALPPESMYREMVKDYRHHEHYTFNSRGDEQLLKAHAANLRSLTGKDYQPANILITSGGLDACRNAILLLTDPQDEICFVEPSWPNSKTMALTFQRLISTVQLKPENNFALPRTVDEWENIVPIYTKLLWLEVSGNPCSRGWTDRQEMQALADFVKARGITAFVDEEYRLLYADKKPRTILEMAAPGILVGSSWDKVFCMTSARLGTLETADPEIATIFQSLGNLVLSAPNPMRLQQHIATIIKNEGWPYLCGLIEEIEKNRNVSEKIIKQEKLGEYLRGKTAFYDGWLLPELKKGATMQALIHSLLSIASALKSGQQPKEEIYSDAVSWSEFFQENGPEGYRLTMSQTGKKLKLAVKTLAEQVKQYIKDGQPNYGSAEEVVEKFFLDKEIKPRTWPKKVLRTHKVEREFIAYQNYLVGP